ncbi:MAG: hypothetical protein ACE5EF_06325 [Dehalococcoidia bacterium]
MVFGRSFRAVAAWLGRLVGFNRQRWVEPGNPITRAVLSGADLTLPPLPRRGEVVWNEGSDALPAEALAAAEPAESPASEPQPGGERTRAA